MWSRKGCRKCHKMVIDQNPYQNPEARCKMAKPEVRRKSGKMTLFSKQ